MEDDNLYQILEKVTSGIKEKTMLWRLDGSANLRVQGLEVVVNDLNITTDRDGIRNLKQLFNQDIASYYYDEYMNAHVLKFRMYDFEIEVMHNENKKFEMFDQIKTIEWRGLHLPVLPPEHAKKYYEMVGRQNKVELIERYLAIVR